MYGDVALGVQKKEGEDHEPFEMAIEGSSTRRITRTSSTAELTVPISRNWSNASRHS